VSTRPAIDEAAAPPAIAQIPDEGATGPLGFVHPQTADLSASSVTILSEQRREPAQARGHVAKSWMGRVVRSKRAQVLVRRLERTAARLLQGHDSLSSGELPRRGLPQSGGGSEEIRSFPTAQIGAYERARGLIREVRRSAIRRTMRFGVDSAIEARTGRQKTISLIATSCPGKSTRVWRRYCIVDRRSASKSRPSGGKIYA
jgi:hypothetical protein